MLNCKPVSTPLIDTKFDEDIPVRPDLEKPYQQLIGSLLYLAITSRPDILYPVTFLSQFNRKPTQQHWTCAQRILRYLKGTSNLSLTYKKSDHDLIGYSDSDWANNCPQRKSFSGNVFTYSDCAISWECQKQKTTSLSSTEAEYIALTLAAKEAIHLKFLLHEIKGLQ